MPERPSIFLFFLEEAMSCCMVAIMVLVGFQLAPGYLMILAVQKQGWEREVSAGFRDV